MAWRAPFGKRHVIRTTPSAESIVRVRYWAERWAMGWDQLSESLARRCAHALHLGHLEPARRLAARYSRALEKSNMASSLAWDDVMEERRRELALQGVGQS